jgi:hypothetical protein
VSGVDKEETAIQSVKTRGRMKWIPMKMKKASKK